MIEPAPIIEHSVSVVGDLKHSFFTNGKDDPLEFLIDGQIRPNLLVRRGETHRFYFDSTVRDYSISFLNEPEKSPPRVRVNMLTDARPDINKGGQYFRNPKITYSSKHRLWIMLITQVGDYLSMLHSIKDGNSSIEKIEDTNASTSTLMALRALLENNITSFSQDNLPYPSLCSCDHAGNKYFLRHRWTD